MNILTFDTEEWFHLLNHDSTRNHASWDNFEKRIEGNVGRILDILDTHQIKATFFVIGWIGKKYPHLVKRIAAKHEIGSHTMYHQLVWQQSPSDFKTDLMDSIHCLEDLIGKKITKFRAPGFSIRRTEGWALEILHEAGITTDSSIFPSRHAHGGIPDYPENEPTFIEYNGFKIKEFPITFKTILQKNIIFSGGGYFRLVPYFLLKKWTAENSKYLISYIHPRDLDPSQPMVPGLNWIRKFKSYYGLSKSERKLHKWLNDFHFIDIEEASKLINWDKCKVIQL